MIRIQKEHYGYAVPGFLFRAFKYGVTRLMSCTYHNKNYKYNLRAHDSMLFDGNKLIAVRVSVICSKWYGKPSLWFCPQCIRKFACATTTDENYRSAAFYIVSSSAGAKFDRYFKTYLNHSIKSDDPLKYAKELERKDIEYGGHISEQK